MFVSARSCRVRYARDTNVCTPVEIPGPVLLPKSIDVVS